MSYVLYPDGNVVVTRPPYGPATAVFYPPYGVRAAAAL